MNNDGDDRNGDLQDFQQGDTSIYTTQAVPMLSTIRSIETPHFFGLFFMLEFKQVIINDK